MIDLKTLPDIQFAEKDPETILNEMISGYEKAYYEQTEENKKLYPGDPIRIFLYSQALKEIQLRQIIDFSAKQNLLKYSSGDYLNNLAAFNGSRVTRLEPGKATVTEKFVLSEPQSLIKTIPIGTRVSPGDRIYFESTENIDIPAGATEITLNMQCTQEGVIGNGFIPGQINILVDPLPWIESVANIDTSQGGSDLEEDDSFRERIWLSPESFSTAGPSGAYEYFAKQYNSGILDVSVDSPSPGVVDIRVLLDNGEIPTQTFIDELKEYLNDKNRRPLTDLLQVNAPTKVRYDIDLTYFILDSNSTAAASIQSKVNEAIENYKLWQKSKIGRAVNPSKLTADIVGAGAYRVEIRSPVFIQLNNTEVASEGNVNVIYGGIEYA